MSNIDLTTGIKVIGQNPLDGKTYFLSLAEMRDLGVGNVRAFSYYEDMKVTCVETHKEYIWRETRNGVNETPVLDVPFTYPVGAISNGITYENRTFNFFEIGDTDGGGGGGFNNGKGTFTWVKYAEDAAGWNMTDDPTSTSTHIGMAYNQLSSVPGTDPELYTWGEIFASQSWVDEFGITHWTWIKYVDSLTQPYGWSDNPLGKKYIGFSFDNLTDEETEVFNDYTWHQALAGNPIAGTDKYLWFKFALAVDGTGITDKLDGATHIGFAYGKTSPYSSVNPTDYTWGVLNGTNINPATDKYTWVKFGTVPSVSIQDSPISASYIGIKVENDLVTESTVYTDYQWFYLGEGSTTIVNPVKDRWTWIKYASSATPTVADMTDLPDGKSYIGLAINKDVELASTNPLDYFWSLLTGAQGYTGADGKQYYIWSKYGTSNVGANLSDVPDGATFIGLAYNKITNVESTNPLDYEWSALGSSQLEQPKWYYTWFKFAEDEIGTNMSDSPEGMSYMGIAYDKTSPDESTDYTDYTWNPIRGEQGYTGPNGQTFWTWIKYATTPSSTTLSDDLDNMTWMGLAFNKTTPDESGNYQDYTWYPIASPTVSGNKPQNNLIRIIKINPNELAFVTEDEIVKWINANSIEVAEDEIVLFQIDGDIDNILVLNSSPIDLSVGSISVNSADLAWNAYNDPAIVRFDLVYVPKGGSGDVKLNVGKTLTYILNSLTSGVTYEAYVIAYDAKGGAKQSNIIDIDVLNNYVALTPLLKAIGVTTTSIKLQWSIDTSFNALTYNLYQVGIVQPIYQGSDLIFEKLGLAAGTEYGFYVEAVSLIDTSLVSATLTLSTDSDVAFTLSPPDINFLNATNDSLEFSIGVPFLELPKIMGYYMDFKKLTDTQWVTTLLTTSTLQQIKNLARDTTYQIRVRSTDGVIQSPDSNILTVSTLDESGVGVKIIKINPGQWIPIVPAGYGNAFFYDKLQLFGGRPNETVRLKFDMRALRDATVFIQNYIVVKPGIAYLDVQLDTNGSWETLISGRMDIQADYTLTVTTDISIVSAHLIDTANIHVVYSMTA